MLQNRPIPVDSMESLGGGGVMSPTNCASLGCLEPEALADTREDPPFTCHPTCVMPYTKDGGGSSKTVLHTVLKMSGTGEH